MTPKKVATLLLKAMMGGFSEPPKWTEKLQPSKQVVLKIKVRHQHAQTHKIIERTLYQYEGVECVCGNKTFRMVDSSFRCVRCRLIPFIMTPKRREFYAQKSPQQTLEWIGVIAPRGLL